MYGLFNKLRSDYVSILKQLKNTEEECKAMLKEIDEYKQEIDEYKQEIDEYKQEIDAMNKEIDAYKVTLKRAIIAMMEEDKSLGCIRRCIGCTEEEFREIARECDIMVME